MGGPITDISTFFNSLSADFFFSKLTFSEKSFKNTIRVSYGLDPDQRLCQMWASFYQKMPECFASSTGNQLQTIAQ